MRRIAPALFVIKAEPEGRDIVVGSDSLRIYHESRTGEPDEAPNVKFDDGGDEYGELLGMPKEDADWGWGAPIYKPREEEALRAERLRNSRVPVIQIQTTPVITQVPRVLRSTYRTPGVNGG